MACTICSPVSTTRASRASTAWPGTPSSCPASSWRTTPGIRTCSAASPAIIGPGRRCRRRPRIGCGRRAASMPVCRWRDSSNSRCSTSGCMPSTPRSAAAACVRCCRRRAGEVAVVPAPGVEPLPEQLWTYFCRRLRGRLLQLQMGRSPCRGCFLGLRGAGRLRPRHGAAVSGIHPVPRGQPGRPGSLHRVPGARSRYPRAAGAAWHSRPGEIAG